MERCFDVAVALDLLEHLVREVRPQVLSELKRVSKVVLLHTPLVGGSFKGGEADAAFLSLLRRRGAKRLEDLGAFKARASLPRRACFSRLHPREA